MCLHTLDLLAAKSDTARKCARTLVSLREQAMANQDSNKPNPYVSLVVANYLAALFTTSSYPEKTTTSQNGDGGMVVDQQTHHGSASNVQHDIFSSLPENTQFSDSQLQDFLWQQGNTPLPWEFQDDWWQDFQS